MIHFDKQKLILKFIILCLCIIEITNGKKLESTVKKSKKISGKKYHKAIDDPLKNVNSDFSFQNRKKFIEKEYELFKLNSETNLNKNKNENKNKKIEKKEKQNDNHENSQNIKNENIKNTNIKTKFEEINMNDLNGNSNQISEDKKNNNNNNYYIYGSGIVSIALIGVGFFNVYQRNRNSIFNLTKEELEALDKRKETNNSYTSLSEEERRFLHKINTRKHNNMRRYDELTEDEILEIRKKNGWADSDDGECQLRRRKVDNRLSYNVKINSTNVVAPRRVSLNVKLDKDLFSKSSYGKSCDDIKKLKRKTMTSLNKNKLLNHSSSYESLKLSKNINTKKTLSIDTKNISMPPIKMICTIIKNYKPLRSDEIKLHLGDKVEIISIYKDGWALGKIIYEDNSDDNNNQKIGYFPLAHASEPEIFDDKINEFKNHSPLTPPVSRSYSNISLQNVPLTTSLSNSYSIPSVNFTNSTSVEAETSKSKNRHVSMIAVSSNILTQEPLSIQNNSSDSSIVNINNNINIINNSIVGNNASSPNINISININNSNNQKCINNSISINGNENSPLINTNTILLNTQDSSNLKYRASSPSILDSQSIVKLLDDNLKDNECNERIASSLYSAKRDSLPCHSQEVFDFLRGNVYNSKLPIEEREYYKKCLERLKISKIIDMELIQADKQKVQEKCD
ncbi:hypothetical protein U3516DRAFT_912032 [Neocallimastix sp. 'constans']